MNINIINFVEQIISLLNKWFSFDKKEFAWCPVRVNNRK